LVPVALRLRAPKVRLALERRGCELRLAQSVPKLSDFELVGRGALLATERFEAVAW
jgi:hypothetical protein